MQLSFNLWGWEWCAVGPWNPRCLGCCLGLFGLGVVGSLSTALQNRNSILLETWALFGALSAAFAEGSYWRYCEALIFVAATLNLAGVDLIAL